MNVKVMNSCITVSLGKKAGCIILGLKTRDSHGIPPPAPKKFKTTFSVGKVKLTAFWDVNCVVHSEFMPTGATVNKH
jgi:hypothetical protein